MMLIFGECKRNKTHTVREYVVCFLGGPHARGVTMENIDTRSREHSGDLVSACVRITFESIFAYALAHPHISIREVRMTCGLTLGRI